MSVKSDFIFVGALGLGAWILYKKVSNINIAQALTDAAKSASAATQQAVDSALHPETHRDEAGNIVPNVMSQDQQLLNAYAPVLGLPLTITEGQIDPQPTIIAWCDAFGIEPVRTLFGVGVVDIPATLVKIFSWKPA